MASRPRLVTVAVLVCVLVALVGGPVRAQSGDRSYTSPTYGFTVTWDPAVWTPDAPSSLTAVGPDQMDRLLLTSAQGSLYVESARRYAGDPAACLKGESDALGAESGISGLQPFSGPDGQPVAGSGPDGAFAAYRATISLPTGGTGELGGYIRCRTLVAGESVLIGTVVAPADDLLAVVDLATPVLDSVVTATAAAASQPSDATFAALRAQAQNRPSVVGPIDGELPLRTGSLAKADANVSLGDLFATATFGNPYPASEHDWDFGLGFRHAGGDEQFRLIVDSGGTWWLKNGTGPVLATGHVDGLDLAAGGRNTLDLAVQGDTGYVAVNGTFVTTLDLSARPGPGDVFAAAGFFSEDVQNGATTRLEGFRVWSLAPRSSAGQVIVAVTPPAGAATPGSDLVGPPAVATPTAGGMDAPAFAAWMTAARAKVGIAGPLAGDLTLTAGQPATIDSGASVADFAAIVRFVAPATPGQPWDAGFVFRGAGATDGYRLVVDSDGQWTLTRGDGTQVGRGPAAAVNRTPGGVNTLELVVAGPTAGLAVNGVFTAAADVSASDTAGGIAFGGGFLHPVASGSAVLRYRDFQVWGLEGVVPPPVGSPTPAAGAATAVPVTPPAPPPSVAGGPQIAARLAAVGGSGVSGLATLRAAAAGGGTVVDLAVNGAADGALATIHAGTCDAIDPAPAFALTDLSAAGRSSTTLRSALADLGGGQYVVTVRAGATNFGTVLACGAMP